MRLLSPLLALVPVHFGCASGVGHNLHKAIRFERTESGRHNYLVILPDEALYCEVLWCLVPPLSNGSNAEAPYAFAGRLASAKVRQELENAWRGAVVDTPSVSARCADEVQRLADRTNATTVERAECSQQLLQQGLLPKLWDIDLDSFGRGEGHGR